MPSNLHQVDAFLEDIVTYTDDITPRLVFADWLDDHGVSTTAEFIRVQCQLADIVDEQCDQCKTRSSGGQHTNGPCRCTKLYKSLRLREQELLTPRNIWDWLGFGHWGPSGTPLAQHKGNGVCRLFHLPNPNNSPEWGVTFRCGFVEEVSLPYQAFLRHGKRLVNIAPLRRVVLSNREPSEQLGHSPIYYNWYNSLFSTLPIAHFHHHLPAELFELLPVGDITFYSMKESRDYSTIQLAEQALSDACLKWARQ